MVNCVSPTKLAICSYLVLNPKLVEKTQQNKQKTSNQPT